MHCALVTLAHVVKVEELLRLEPNAGCLVIFVKYYLMLKYSRFRLCGIGFLLSFPTRPRAPVSESRVKSYGRNT